MGFRDNPYPLATIFGSELPDKVKGRLNEMKTKSFTSKAVSTQH